MPTLKIAGAEFLNLIKPFAPAYSDPLLSYVARQTERGLEVLKGRVFLFDRSPLLPTYQSKTLRAQQLRLRDCGYSIGSFIDAVASGKVELPDDELIFPLTAPPTATLVPYHSEGLEVQSRLSVLMLQANANRRFPPQPMIDWELRATNPPFESLAELMIEYRLGPPNAESPVLEIVAGQIANVLYNSYVKGKNAKPSVIIDRRLDPHNTALGIRIFHGGKVVERKYIEGREMDWEEGADLWTGIKSLDVPDGAILHCTLSYSGEAVHYGWLKDSDSSQNLRRAALEMVDPQLATTKSLLSESAGRGRSSKSSDFERGVAWLVWMLGFSVVHFGDDPRTTDGVDILAVTPAGHFLAIECTIGLLKAENKMANLLARTAKLRKTLDSAGSQSARLIPLMVSLRPRAELKAELEQAELHGVLVAAREDIVDALDTRTLFPPNADNLYAEAEAQLADAANRRSTKETELRR